MKEQLLSVGIDIGTSAPRGGSRRAGAPWHLKALAEMNSACGILRLASSRFAGPKVVEVPV